MLLPRNGTFLLDLIGSQNSLPKGPEHIPRTCAGLFYGSILLRGCHAMDMHMLRHNSVGERGSLRLLPVVAMKFGQVGWIVHTAEREVI